ncbi:HEAT repeat domain-containing protein [Streptomyces sp. DH-12]|uniref:HEAT repeat domain-containing protein n=1 Tax=Streptomyces sp. DH-12 TaxID=2072509 RepID=UPI000D1CEF5C|nr:HEAT repeat domain-containing protein [Streptomyces sp. DH-12]
MPPLSDDQQLSALFEQANSPAWSVRAAAGRQLAAAPRTDQAVEVLFRLLLDPDDTAVTRETAQALLERGDTSPLRRPLECGHGGSCRERESMLCPVLLFELDR